MPKKKKSVAKKSTLNPEAKVFKPKSKDPKLRIPRTLSQLLRDDKETYHGNRKRKSKGKKSRGIKSRGIKSRGRKSRGRKSRGRKR